MQPATRHTLLAAFCLLASLPARAQGSPPGADRPHALLAQMTQAEKQSLLWGHIATGPNRPQGAIGSAGYVPGIPRLGIPALQETDASLGITNPEAVRGADGATALPSGLALAASWDPSLAQQAGAVLGHEAAARGFNVLLGPGLNLVRDSRGGRGFEYLGEDPLLAGILAAAEIRGIQAWHVAATAKHFAANDLENGRNAVDIRAPWDDLRASDLLAFEIALQQGHPAGIMCAYNRLNGAYACENPTLLTDILRRDWHFPGFVLSDWGAVHSLAALTAGLDQESAVELDAQPYFAAPLTQALATRAMPPAALDTAVLHILTGMDQAGLLAPAAQHPAENPGQGAAMARQEALAGIVLLRNEHALLPLQTPASIAVIGLGADAGVPAGGGSSLVTPRGGFARRTVFAGNGQGVLARAQALTGPAPLARLRAIFPAARITFTDGRYPEEAIRAAAHAQITLVFVSNWSGESEDLPSLALPQGQDALIEAIASKSRHSIVVLQTAGAVTMPWRDRVAAILQAWYPGQEGAQAIADILAGTAAPSGHLPVTFPASVQDLPTPALPNPDPASPSPAPVTFPEGASAGYRWFADTGRGTLYPFGYGLTYTSFALKNFRVTASPPLSVQADVTNTGTREGAALPQAYLLSRGGKPCHRLLGFEKTLLAPGQTAHITLHPDPRLLADFADHAWHVPAGELRIGIGFDAAHMQAAGSVTVPAQDVAP